MSAKSKKPKNKIKKIKGIKVVEKIQGDKDRPLVPRTAVFEMKTKYKRSAEKARARRETRENTYEKL